MASEELKSSDLLTFGEAAEYAGISLLDLRERLRAAKVPAVWGWRAGSAIHLVTLESLRTTFPGIGDRHRLPNRSLKERGIEVLPENKSDTTGGEATKPKQTTLASGQQLGDLHGEIEQAVAKNAKLIAELSDAESGVGKIIGDMQSRNHPSPSGSWMDPLRGTSPARVERVDKVQKWKELEAQQQKLEQEHKSKQRSTWAVTGFAAVVFVAVVSLKSKDMLLASSGPDPAPGMASPDPERNGGDSDTHFSDAGLFPAASPLDFETADGLSAGLLNETGLVTFETASGVTPAVEVLSGSDQEEPNQEFVTPTAKPLAPLVIEQAEPTTDAATDAALELSPLIQSKAPACLYSKLTAPGQELRTVLGPCIGPWNENAQAVAGGFRHSGERYCRHHLIVAKDMGGSVDRARNVARYAHQEGLIAPLVRLRVEHGAADLLQKRIGKWVESGFEAGLSGQHEVRPCDGDDCWSIRSWVRLQAKPGGIAELKYFSMTIQLGANKGRDSWKSFDWLAEAPSKQ